MHLFFKCVVLQTQSLVYIFFVDYNIFAAAQLVSSLGYVDAQKLHLCFRSEYTWIIINMELKVHTTVIGIIKCVSIFLFQLY